MPDKTYEVKTAANHGMLDQKYDKGNISPAYVPTHVPEGPEARMLANNRGTHFAAGDYDAHLKQQINSEQDIQTAIKMPGDFMTNLGSVSRARQLKPPSDSDLGYK